METSRARNLDAGDRTQVKDEPELDTRSDQATKNADAKKLGPRTDRQAVWNYANARHVTPNDIPYIVCTWRDALYYGNDWMRQIPRRIFKECYEKVINHILNKPSTIISIICLRSEPSCILSYMVVEQKENMNILHFTFTSTAWRNMGLAKSQLPAEVHQVSHLTKIGKSIKRPSWAFNPFID